MSTFTSEPGIRLGGRYRLEDRVSANSGWSAWKAIDETLARPVAVLTFTPGFPRISEAVTAARTASRLSDARLAKVFDVEEDWDHAYVVMEWVAGDSLEDLLADGPLDPRQGGEIIAQAAEALASAHAAGVAHLCLTPGSLRWTQGGGVKVIGLGVDAALTGATAEDPALADTRGLARLLYAALTAHWPGDDWPGLPPAPEVDGHPRSPRQVRAGVPAPLDEITCRALIPRDGHGDPITTPAVLATTLAEVIPAPAAPPPLTPPPAAPEPAMPPGPAYGTAYWQGNGGRSRRSRRPPDIRPARRGGASRLLVAAVIVLVTAAVVLGGFALLRQSRGGHRGGSTTGHHSSSPNGGARVLKPLNARGFDALSPSSADPSNENSDMARFAIDGNPATAWETQWYQRNPRFGGLKSGTGLILDMGKPVRLSSVTVTFGATPGADVRIELGNSNRRAPGTLSQFTTVAQQNNVGGTYTFTTHSTSRGRYVLIWFTLLPPTGHGTYQAKIFNDVVRGAG